MGIKTIKISEKEKEFILKKNYQANPELLFAWKINRLPAFLDKVANYEMVVHTDYSESNGNKYLIKAAEVVAYLKEHVSDDFFSINMTKEDLLSKYAFIEYLDPEEYTEEIVRKAIKKNYNNYLLMPEEQQKRFRMLLLELYPYKNEGFSKEELLAGIRKNPEIFEHLPKEMVDKELLYCYLEQLVKTNYICSGYYWENVPNELKDKVYHQSRAMVNPFYLNQVPDEYKSPKLIKYSFDHMFDKTTLSHTRPLDILRSGIEYMTEDMILDCCVKHFSGVTLLPKEYKNDTFYRKLMNAGMYDFICNVDLTTISKELVLECMQKMKRGQFWFWQDKFPKNFWTEELALEYARISNMFYKHVPKKMITKEMALINLANHRTLEEMPKTFLDDAAIDVLMERSYGMLEKIPKGYLTPEFYKKNIANRKIYFKDVPKEYLTIEVINDYIDNGCSVDFCKIPSEMITKDLIMKLARRNISYHFDQGHQTPEMSEWIYFTHKELFISGDYHNEITNYAYNSDYKVNMRNKIYMYRYITENMVTDMLSYLNPHDIAGSMLNHHGEVNTVACDLLFHTDPSCMIEFPEDLREKYRSIMEEYDDTLQQVTPDDTLVTNPNEVTILPVSNDADISFCDSFTQLSLFDFLGNIS